MQAWRTRPALWPSRLLEAVRPHLDLVLVVVVTAAASTPALAGRGTLLGWEQPVRDLDVLAAVLVLGHTLPLALRRRSPGWCLLLVSLSAAAYQGLGYRQTVASIAVYVALYSVGSRQRRHRLATATAWLLGYAALCLTLLQLGSTVPPVELVEFLALPAGCWLAGALAGAGLAQQRARQARELEAALEEERAGLARDLHDVVTHHVTAMVLQAEAVAYVPAGDRGAVAAAGTAIATSGRRALADLRDLLGVLHPAHEAPATPGTGVPGAGYGGPRTPTLVPVDELVEGSRRAAQPVTLTTEGEPRPLDGLPELALHRVVQEGLTNALKHAPGRPTHVRLSYRPAGTVEVEVRTEGRPAPAEGHPAPAAGTVAAPPPSPGGRGLTGLRRRVELAGGRLEAAGREDGAFVLSATLPAGPRP